MKEGWTYKKLGEVCNVLNGLWIGKKEPFVNVAVIRNTNFSKDCKLKLDDVAYIDVEERQFATRKLQVGDIIIEKSGGSDKQPVGRPVLFNIPDGDYSFSNFTSTLRLTDKSIFPPFLHYCLYGYYRNGETKKMQSKTTGLRNLDMKAYLRLAIPYFEIGEQERIVAELDLLQGIIEKKKEQLKAYDQLAQSIFYTMFGDPIDNPKGWETKCFCEIVHSTQLGLIRSAKMQSIDNKYLYFKMNNITSSGQMDLSNITRIDANSEEIEKYQLHKGDFLFNTRNSYELVGKSCVFNGKEKDIVLFNNNLLRIIFKNNTNSVFISYLFNDEYVKKQLNGIKKGTTSVWAVYYKDLAHIKVLVPPLSLQQEFAEKVEAIERQKALVQQSIEETQTMFDYTMDKYFG